MTAKQALHTAYDQRADFQSAQATVRAAEYSVSAARAQRYPNLGVSGDYGDVGTTPASSNGTFTFQVAAKFNIFDGGRISGDIVQARAALSSARMSSPIFAARSIIRSGRLCLTSSRPPTR